MKKLKIISGIIVLFTMLKCGSVSNYTNNTLNKNFYNSKVIYFTLNSKSEKNMSVTGMAVGVLGGYKAPNVKKVFEESIHELATETTLNLKYVENDSEITDKDAIKVDVEIREINWNFGFSVGTLKTEVYYSPTNSTEFIYTTGIRKSGGGSESNNLRKSLKNANYKFLQEFEKSK